MKWWVPVHVTRVSLGSPDLLMSMAALQEHSMDSYHIYDKSKLSNKRMTKLNMGFLQSFLLQWLIYINWSFWMDLENPIVLIRRTKHITYTMHLPKWNINGWDGKTHFPNSLTFLKIRNLSKRTICLCFFFFERDISVLPRTT